MAQLEIGLGKRPQTLPLGHSLPRATARNRIIRNVEGRDYRSQGLKRESVEMGIGWAGGSRASSDRLQRACWECQAPSQAGLQAIAF